MNFKYNDFFKIEEDKPIREKVFLARIAVSVTLIVVYLFAMGFAAFGLFAVESSSSENVITTSRYVLDIKVNNVETDYSRTAEEILPSSSGIYTLQPGEYTLKLTKPVDDPSVSSTGFAIISLYSVETAEEKETYYTKPIGTMLIRDENREPILDEKGDYMFTECASRNFNLIINEEAYLSIVSSWGSYSGSPFTETTIVFGDNQ